MQRDCGFMKKVHPAELHLMADFQWHPNHLFFPPLLSWVSSNSCFCFLLFFIVLCLLWKWFIRKHQNLKVCTVPPLQLFSFQRHFQLLFSFASFSASLMVGAEPAGKHTVNLSLFSSHSQWWLSPMFCQLHFVKICILSFRYCQMCRGIVGFYLQFDWLVETDLLRAQRGMLLFGTSKWDKQQQSLLRWRGR